MWARISAACCWAWWESTSPGALEGCDCLPGEAAAARTRRRGGKAVPRGAAVGRPPGRQERLPKGCAVGRRHRERDAGPHRAVALQGLGPTWFRTYDVVLVTLTCTLCRKKDRSDLFAARFRFILQTDKRLRARRYERALVSKDLGRRVRSELENPDSEASEFMNVAARLGIAAVTPKGGDNT